MMVERSPLPVLSAVSEICDVEDVDKSGPSEESGGGFTSAINQNGLNEKNRRGEARTTINS